MKNNYNNKNKNKSGNKKSADKEKKLSEIKSKLRSFNILCVCVLALTFLTYFCDFFRLNIDGNIENKISGFKLSFIQSGGALKSKNNILSVLNKNYSGKIKFAAVSSMLSLFSVLALMGILIYRAVKNKPLLSKTVLIFASCVLVLLIIQIAACYTLAAFVTKYYYSGCVTCIAETMSYIPIIPFMAFVIIYFGLSYRIYCKYGIAFKNN